MKELTLAHTYVDGLVDDFSGYLVSEKYDGVRAYFDGSEIWSRHGNRIKAPEAWLNQLRRVTSCALDGELWMGRGKFQETSACVRRTRNVDEKAWEDVVFMAFDMPSEAGEYDVRYEKLQRFVRGGSFNLMWAAQSPIGDQHKLKKLFDLVVSKGGEGLMLRKIKDGGYTLGRSYNLLKMKP